MDNMIDIPQVTKDILDGKVIILPADTIYGISCSYANKEAVQKIFDIKGRSASKSLVVLIANSEQLQEMGINPSEKERELMEKYWPGALTIAFTPDLAVRLPDNDILRTIIEVTGPIVSTSANRAGFVPAENIDEAKNMFGSEIDAYYDDGPRNAAPSTLVKVENNEIKVLRQGAVVLY